jgi:hypothetical protein
MEASSPADASLHAQVSSVLDKMTLSVADTRNSVKKLLQKYVAFSARWHVLTILLEKAQTIWT